MVALAAMDVAEHPVRHLGHRPRQGTVGADDLVGLAGEHRVVQRRGDGGVERGRVIDLLPVEDRAVGADAFDREGVRPGGQGNQGRRGRRQPGVGYVHHRLAVDGEVVPARHLLAHVQQEGVGAVLGNVDAAGEGPGEAPLPPVAGGAGGVHRLALAVLAGHGQRDGLVRRVEVRQAVIVPEQAVALVGQDEGQGDLRVHLREPPRDAPDVQETVLELARAVEELVLGGGESQGCVVGGLSLDRSFHEAVAVLAEENVAIGIEEGQDTALIAGGHRGGAHFDDAVFLGDLELGRGHLLHIDEFVQRFVIGRFQADPDGIVHEGLEHQRAFVRLDADFFPRAAGQQQDARDEDQDSFHGHKALVRVMTPAESAGMVRKAALPTASGVPCWRWMASLLFMRLAASSEPGA